MYSITTFKEALKGTDFAALDVSIHVVDTTGTNGHTINPVNLVHISSPIFCMCL